MGSARQGYSLVTRAPTTPRCASAHTPRVVIAVVRTIDGGSNWLEGALIGVYALIAITFWWG
jgi:hypothetical protein